MIAILFETLAAVPAFWKILGVTLLAALGLHTALRAVALGVKGIKKLHQKYEDRRARKKWLNHIIQFMQRNEGEQLLYHLFLQHKDAEKHGWLGCGFITVMHAYTDRLRARIDELTVRDERNHKALADLKTTAEQLLAAQKEQQQADLMYPPLPLGGIWSTGPGADIAVNEPWPAYSTTNISTSIDYSSPLKP